MSYQPSASFAIKEWDEDYLRHGEAAYPARLYQPDGDGPFPMILMVHGGAWNGGSRLGHELISRALASSGLVVASIDFRIAPEHPYPAQVQDVHYASRWLKHRAAELRGDPDTVGVWGGSSGGHTALLCALRPRDPRYSALPLSGVGGAERSVERSREAALSGGLGDGRQSEGDGSFRFVISCWGVIDPWVRFLFAQTTPEAGAGYGGAEAKIRQTMNYFENEAAIHEGNPQEILEREEAQALPPILIIQGTEDMNIPLTLPQRFAPAYRAAGGTVQVEWFPGQPHGFASNPSPDSTRAIEVMKAFIAQVVNA
ncbi:MAG TPA: alpha/beta hydrolase [Chloroflexota bacterium]